MILVIFFVKCLFEPNFVISIYVVNVLQMSKVCKKKIQHLNFSQFI